jgi:hypothetical protein
MCWEGNPGIPAAAFPHLICRRVGSRGCGGAVSRAKREPPLLRIERNRLRKRLSFGINGMAAGELERQKLAGEYLLWIPYVPLK